MPERRPDIALSTWSVTDGALATLTVDLAKGFLHHGCSVDVVSTIREAPFPELEFPVGANLVQFGRRSRASAVPLARYLRERQPGALITVAWVQNAPGLVAKALARYRGLLLLTEHHPLTWKVQVEHRDDAILRRMGWFARHFYRYADAVVSVSDAVGTDLEKVGVRSVPLVTIPNPVDGERVRRLSHEPIEAPVFSANGDGGPVFVCVARLSTPKDHALLIEAFARYRKRSGRGRLVIIGTGPLRDELQSRIDRLGIGAYARLTGFVPNQHQYVGAADVFVLATNAEGFPLALIEAMAVGTPIVATDCIGGMRETLGDGTAGLLVPPHDVDALSEGMQQVAEDPELRARLVAGGQARVKALAPEEIAGQWLELIERLRRERG